MTIKITGLDKLQRQLKEAEQALEALNGRVADLKFNPNDPKSVQAAITQMEAAVDDKLVSYRGNTIVEKVARAAKEKFREVIMKKAAGAKA